MTDNEFDEALSHYIDLVKDRIEAKAIRAELHEQLLTKESELVRIEGKIKQAQNDFDRLVEKKAEERND